jgi:hypothetical protein
MTDDTFLVLNGVYLRKIASPQVIRECSGLAPAAIRSIVDEFVAAETLVDVGGETYMLTTQGTAEVLGQYTQRYADLRGADDVEDWYQRFEIVNSQFLQLISAWQTSGEGDTELGKLIRLVQRHARSLEQFAPRLPRYKRYADRLNAALEKVDNGEGAYVTSPTVDSIHNIWFEFHEDILTVLGRPRDVAEEGAAR